MGKYSKIFNLIQRNTIFKISKMGLKYGNSKVVIQRKSFRITKYIFEKIMRIEYNFFYESYLIRINLQLRRLVYKIYSFYRVFFMGRIFWNLRRG